MKRIITSLEEGQIERLKVGDEILLSGVIYTVRDRAHKRLIETMEKRRKLPFDIREQIVYYCGPTPAKKGKVIGSCGPTTSSRMDEFTPKLLKAGIKCMIGKGVRSKEVVKAIKKYKGVYFLTYSGCGALLSKFVKKAKLRAFKDLGPEAIYEFEVRDFPLIVAIDLKGRSIYDKAG